VTYTRLLIVEDAPEVAYYVARLMPRDFVVDFAANGEEALAKAEATVPDIIVTDIMMPGIDGLELCRRVRNNDLLCHIPVVMVTARTSPQDRIDGLQAGADAYLEKPFRSEELSVCVAKLLEQRRLLQMKYSPSSDPSSPTPDPSRGGEGSIYNHRGEVAADVTTPLPSAGGAGGGAGGAGGGAIAPDPFMLRIDEQLSRQIQSAGIDFEQLASDLCITRVQLNRKVKAITGVSMREYVQRIRLEKAKRLLKPLPLSKGGKESALSDSVRLFPPLEGSGEALTIAEVARACGFDDAAYFSRFFRKMTGLTPSEYARKDE